MEVLRGRDGRDGRDGVKGEKGDVLSSGVKGEHGYQDLQELRLILEYRELLVLVGQPVKRECMEIQGCVGLKENRDLRGQSQEESFTLAGVGQLAPLTRVHNSYILVEGTQLLYSGRAGGTHYLHSAGGANYLCMPDDPDHLEYQSGVQDDGFVAGVEYDYNGMPTLSTFCNHNVPCAVCYICGH